MFMLISSFLNFMLVSVVSLRLTYVYKVYETRYERIKFSISLALFSAILAFILLGGEWNCDNATCLYKWSIH